jgi:hypothetical protein
MPASREFRMIGDIECLKERLLRIARERASISGALLLCIDGRQEVNQMHTYECLRTN